MANSAVLITGASSGFGKCIADRLQAAGLFVIGTSRSATFPGKLDPGTINMLPLDVCNDESVEAVWRYLETHRCHVDTLVLNEGYGISGPVEETTPVEAQAQFETNFFGVHRMVRWSLPMMREKRAGKIIIIGSVGGLIGVPFWAFYSASKFALEGYAESLRAEVMAHGIAVSLVEPGDYNTGFTAKRDLPAADPNGPYEPQSSRAIRIMEKGEEHGGDPTDVGELVYQITQSPNPKLRYLSGSFIEKLAVQLKKVLPGTAFEKMIMDTYKVPRE